MDYYFLWFAGLELSLIVNRQANSSILVYRGNIYNLSIEYSRQMMFLWNKTLAYLVYFGIEVFPNLNLNHLLYYDIAMVDLLA